MEEGDGKEKVEVADMLVVEAEEDEEVEKEREEDNQEEGEKEEGRGAGGGRRNCRLFIIYMAGRERALTG